MKKNLFVMLTTVALITVSQVTPTTMIMAKETQKESKEENKEISAELYAKDNQATYIAIDTPIRLEDYIYKNLKDGIDVSVSIIGKSIKKDNKYLLLDINDNLDKYLTLDKNNRVTFKEKGKYLLQFTLKKGDQDIINKVWVKVAQKEYANVKGITDLKVIKGEELKNPLENITFNKDKIKDVYFDKSKVDTDKIGTYNLAYIVENQDNTQTTLETKVFVKDKKEDEPQEKMEVVKEVNNELKIQDTVIFNTKTDKKETTEKKADDKKVENTLYNTKRTQKMDNKDDEIVITWEAPDCNSCNSKNKDKTVVKQEGQKSTNKKKEERPTNKNTSKKEPTKETKDEWVKVVIPAKTKTEKIQTGTERVVDVPAHDEIEVEYVDVRGPGKIQASNGMIFNTVDEWADYEDRQAEAYEDEHGNLSGYSGTSYSTIPGDLIRTDRVEKTIHVEATYKEIPKYENRTTVIEPEKTVWKNTRTGDTRTGEIRYSRP